MLNIIFSHWSVYLYLFDLIALTILFFVDYAHRKAQDRKDRLRRAAFATAPVAASEHTARFRRAGNNVFPAEYRYGQSHETIFRPRSHAPAP